MELLPFLLKEMTKSSRNSVKSILTRGQVTIDGQMVKQHNYSLQPGQKVEVLSNQAAQSKSKLTGLTILHEDEDIIVVNKDAGLLSVASTKGKRDDCVSPANGVCSKCECEEQNLYCSSVR